MNQILNTKTHNNNKLKKKMFKIQFYFSIFVLIIILAYVCSYLFNLYKKEYISKSLIQNYNISKIYSNNNSNSNYKISNNSNTIFGIIEIPKLAIYYPIFSNLDEELLKISPCKFFGDSPQKNGNICIAGHNYNNSMFFSNLDTLSIDDNIFIFDNDGQKYVYTINKIYEVHVTDLSPIFNYEKNEKILTLITCNNNNNSNRIIVRANQ